VQAEERIVERRRFTVEEYHKMAEAGIFGEDDRVELMDGEVVEMNPIGWRHARCVSRPNKLLVRAAEDRCVVSVQNPIALSEHGEPQPDLVIHEEPPPGCLPAPEDILLLVEVSNPTLPYDRNVKLPRYARAGIPEVWIVDLQGEALERYNDRRQDGYRRTEKARTGEELASEVLPGLLVPADAALGK
jgi:Uma2 family endonuclease